MDIENLKKIYADKNSLRQGRERAQLARNRVKSSNWAISGKPQKQLSRKRSEMMSATT